jgi:predicted GNAT family acetyltransferase
MGEREGRDLNYAQQLAYQSILQQTSCHWEDNNKIVTIASIIDSESHLPIVGSLYTNPEDRGKGYAKCLVHDLTSQIVAAKGQCGIVTDAADAITNQMFLSIGYEETSRYTSAHTMRETI